MKERLIALYETGETTYLDVLLSSKSITDFISKYYVVSEIAESDKNLMERIEQNKIETIQKMLKNNVDYETISRITEKTIEEIKEIEKGLE